MRKWALLGALGWTVLILAMCSWPREGLTPYRTILSFDKAVHGAGFSLQALLLLASGMSMGRTFSAGLLLALVTEGIQASFPRLGRSGDVLDVLADMMGVLLILGLAAVLRSRRSMVGNS